MKGKGREGDRARNEERREEDGKERGKVRETEGEARARPS
jgi:hypothetical protein